MTGCSDRPASDPTLGLESKAMIVNGRVADNTLQQYVLFLAGSLALAASLSPRHMQVIGGATHAHPTFSEVMGEAAMAVDGRSINF